MICRVAMRNTDQHRCNCKLFCRGAIYTAMSARTVNNDQDRCNCNVFCRYVIYTAMSDQTGNTAATEAAWDHYFLCGSGHVALHSLNVGLCGIHSEKLYTWDCFPQNLYSLRPPLTDCVYTSFPAKPCHHAHDLLSEVGRVRHREDRVRLPPPTSDMLCTSSGGATLTNAR